MTIEEEFAEFWVVYPLKRGKLDALKAFRAARKIAQHEDIMVGLSRYMFNKPVWQARKYPASWLRAGGWMDEWMDDYEEAAVGVQQDMNAWYEECQRMHNGECGLNRLRHDQRKFLDAERAKQVQS